jgi:hypothetical protein
MVSLPGPPVRKSKLPVPLSVSCPAPPSREPPTRRVVATVAFGAVEPRHRVAAASTLDEEFGRQDVVTLAGRPVVRQTIRRSSDWKRVVRIIHPDAKIALHGVEGVRAWAASQDSSTLTGAQLVIPLSALEDVGLEAANVVQRVPARERVRPRPAAQAIGAVGVMVAPPSITRVAFDVRTMST